MSNSYKLLVTALAGCVICIALFAGAFFGSIYAPEKRHYQSIGPNSGQAYPAESPRNGPADLSGIDSFVESLIAKPQPRNTNEREQRDLAAQESMAVFAYWMFWAMILQTLLAGGALIALVKDLRQNRRSAETQLRAYLAAETDGVRESNKFGYWALAINISNKGQTPAHNVVVFSKFAVGDPSEFDPSENPILAGPATDISIFPDSSHHVYTYIAEDFLEPHEVDIRDKNIALIHYGWIAYRDVFDNWWETHFAFYHWGEELSGADARRCRIGNIAN